MLLSKGPMRPNFFFFADNVILGIFDGQTQIQFTSLGFWNRLSSGSHLFVEWIELVIFLSEDRESWVSFHLKRSRNLSGCGLLSSENDQFELASSLLSGQVSEPNDQILAKWSLEIICRPDIVIRHSQGCSESIKMIFGGISHFGPF